MYTRQALTLNPLSHFKKTHNVAVFLLTNNNATKYLSDPF